MVNSPSISDALVTDYEGAKTELENLYNHITDMLYYDLSFDGTRRVKSAQKLSVIRKT